jgi:histone H4
MAGRGKNNKVSKKPKHTRMGVKEIKEGNVTNGAIRRLARRGGVKRIAMASHNNIREYIDDFMLRIVRDCLTYTEHRKARTITAMDVVYSLKKNGRVIYGYGG